MKIIKTAILFALACCTNLSVSGQVAYRDLNKNGKMDDYENKDLPAEKRAENLLSQMTLAEKVGSMFHTYSALTKDGSIDKLAMMTGGKTTDKLIVDNYMTHFNLTGDVPALAIAKYNNLLQHIAESTRLGIPITLSSDPRSSYKETDGATTISAGDFTAFPEPLGMAAAGSSYDVYKAAQIMASEYKATGIRMVLNPMADVATEPRWARTSGTFGENADVVADMVNAYINGFQGTSVDGKSVACITKHFPGNGPQDDGWDGHFSYGRNLVYPGNNFDYHIRSFKAAVNAGTAGMMTAYGIVNQSGSGKIGASFDKEITTDLLKNKLGFKGIVVADWNTLTDKYVNGMKIIEARGWGLDNATLDEKLIAILAAGVNQIGGETATSELVALVEKGKIPESVINASVLKIMTLKFELGLFDNPYVDESKVSELVGNAANKRIGTQIQQKSIVLLENKDNLYPLKKGQKIFVDGYKNKQKFAAYGELVDNIEDCDFAIVKLKTPYGPPNSNSFLEKYIRQGTLAYSDSVSTTIVKKLRMKPSVVVVNLERAAVIPEIAKNATVLLAEFGVSEDALLPVLFGEIRPQGKLPIELPSSMQAVSRQKEDVPYDSENPLYPYGYGLTEIALSK